MIALPAVFLACGCGFCMWFGAWSVGRPQTSPGPVGGGGPLPAGKPPTGNKVPPADPMLTPPDKREPADWQPQPPAQLDFPPIAASELTGLVGYWPLDEGQGTTTADKSGRSPPAKVVGGWWVTGVRGKAILFDGFQDFINLGEAVRLNLGDGEPFSVSVWVATRNDAGTVVLLRHAANGAPLISLQIDGGAVQALVRADNPESGEARLSGPKVSDRRWHHLTLSRDKIGWVTLYVDGVRIGGGIGENSKGPITTNLRILGSERYLVLQGKGFNAPVHYLDGAVDEFAFFNRELTAEEVKRLAGKR